MGRRTEDDIKFAEQKKKINKMKRKEKRKLQRAVNKAVKAETPTKRHGYSRKTAQKRLNNQHRIGVLTARASRYPQEFPMHQHNVYLNPMKKLLRGEGYKNPEYQAVLIGIIQDFMRKQAMEAKAQETVATSITQEAPNA